MSLRSKRRFERRNLNRNFKALITEFNKLHHKCQTILEIEDPTYLDVRHYTKLRREAICIAFLLKLDTDEMAKQGIRENYVTFRYLAYDRFEALRQTACAQYLGVDDIGIFDIADV